MGIITLKRAGFQKNQGKDGVVDVYEVHRLALLPLISDNILQALETVKDDVGSIGEKPFLQFIINQGLGGLWYNVLEKASFTFSSEFKDTLKKLAHHNAARYLQQQYILSNIENLFKEQSVQYAVFKGAHIREILYSQPSVRAACDIDILVSEHESIRAIHILMGDGAVLHPSSQNISHEVSLSSKRVSIDLHWNLFRPGRTRENFSGEFLRCRRNYSGRYALSDEATLFIMLVHPVFAKYATAPQSTLVRIVELLRWINTRDIDWDILQDWLRRGGVQTAAWIMAEWLYILTGVKLPQSFLQTIQPSSLKLYYLRRWIERNYSLRLLRFPGLIQLGLTLPAHDRFSDVCRAVLIMSREKRRATAKMLKLQEACGYLK